MPDSGKTEWKSILGFVLVWLLTPAILFLSFGHLDWPMAWVYTGLYIVAVTASRLIVLRKHPDLLTERARFTRAEGVKDWDRRLVPIIGLYGPLVMLIVAGLDKRFGWLPEVPLALQIIAALVLAAGYLLSIWAMIVNRFFSAVVRIQKDRGHTVVTSGPYRFARHPSYAGGIASYLATPVMLDALWALIPAGLIVIALIIRAALEDQTLQTELPGYAEYARRTRYRLMPGIW